MVLLDGLPDFPAWPGPEPWQGAIDIGFTLGDLTAAADDARAGRPAAAPWIEAACQTATDDSLAPPGRHVLSMFCQCFPADTDAEAAADTAIARFAEVCPELPGRVLDRLALGPKELEARFGITGGHIFHGEMLPGQLLEQRPDRRRFGGIESLYLAGSGAHPGGAVTGAPGLLAARAVLEDAGGRLVRGALPGHPRAPRRRARPPRFAESRVEVRPERLPPTQEELLSSAPRCRRLLTHAHRPRGRRR